MTSPTTNNNGKPIFDRHTYDDSFMYRVRKIPVQVKAIQVTVDFEVETLEGKMQGKAGDYLIKGVKGELYPIDKDIFHETYEFVRDSTQ